MSAGGLNTIDFSLCNGPVLETAYVYPMDRRLCCISICKMPMQTLRHSYQVACIRQKSMSLLLWLSLAQSSLLSGKVFCKFCCFSCLCGCMLAILGVESAGSRFGTNSHAEEVGASFAFYLPTGTCTTQVDGFTVIVSAFLLSCQQGQFSINEIQTFRLQPFSSCPAA